MSHQDAHSRPHSPKGIIKDVTKAVGLGEELDLVVGLAATAVAADQVIKLTGSKKHKAAHLAKAGLGAAVATTAFTMMAREHHEKKEEREKRREELEYHERMRGYDVGRGRQWGRQHGYVESLADSSDDDENMHVAIVPHPRRRGTSLYGYRREIETEHRHRDARWSRSPSLVRSRSRSRSRSQPRGRSQTPGPEAGRKRARSDPGWVKFLELVKDSLDDRNRRG